MKYIMFGNVNDISKENMNTFWITYVMKQV